MKLFRKIREYFATHFASMFVVMLGFVFYVVLSLQQQYLRREYLQYLERQNEEVETTLIDYIQQDLDDIFQDLIQQGSRLSADAEIYQGAQAARNADPGTKMNVLMDLSEDLKRNINTGRAIVIAVGSEEGMLAQYDRLRTTDGRTMWQNDYLPDFLQMAGKMKEAQEAQSGTSGRDLPVAQIYMEPGNHPGESRTEVFHVVLPLTGGRLSVWNTPYAAVSTYPLQLLRTPLDKVRMHQVDYLRGYVTDAEGKVMLTASGQEALKMENIPAAPGKDTVFSRDLNYFGWKLNIEVDETAMRAYVDHLFNKAYRINQAVLFLILIFSLLLLYRMLRPVRRLSEAMKEAGQGDYRTKVEVQGSNELWQVAEEYNHMIEKIREKNEEVREQHETALRSIAQQHEAEREALESQINAHFICNTLGCINYEAMEAGDHEVSLLLKKLSNILRYTFDQKHQEVVIAQEIAWVDQYLYLQRMRREDLFDYEILFPEVYGQWPCCKLMFQPFVENSILHGFEGLQNGGKIKISAFMQGERLKITIEDNGCGISGRKKELIEQILTDGSRTMEYQQGIGIGIHNVVTRMRMFYGEDFEISMETAEGKGTSFTFLLPLTVTGRGESE